MTETTAPRRRLTHFKQGLEYLGVGRTRAYELIAAGKIIAVKDGSRTKIDLDSVDEYQRSLARLPVKQASRGK